MAERIAAAHPNRPGASAIQSAMVDSVGGLALAGVDPAAGQCPSDFGGPGPCGCPHTGDCEDQRYCRRPRDFRHGQPLWHLRSIFLEAITTSYFLIQNSEFKNWFKLCNYITIAHVYSHCLRSVICISVACAFVVMTTGAHAILQ